MASGDLGSIVGGETSRAQKVLAFQAERNSGQVLVAAAAVLRARGFVFQSQNIDETVEIERSREIVKPVSVGNVDDRRTFWTTERRVSLASLGGCVFVDAVEAKAVKARQTLRLVDRVDTDRTLGFLFQATEELLHLHVA